MPKATKTNQKPEQELQAKYVQYQVLRQQLAAYLEEKTIMDTRLNELNVTIDALHRLDEIKKGDEMWSQLGSGAFIRSDIKDVDKVMISIGAGIVVKETMPRCIEILQSRLEEINSIYNEMASEITKISSVLEKLEPQLEMLAHEIKNE